VRLEWLRLHAHSSILTTSYRDRAHCWGQPGAVYGGAGVRQTQLYGDLIGLPDYLLDPAVNREKTAELVRATTRGTHHGD
jgi:hypothetical protein